REFFANETAASVVLLADRLEESGIAERLQQEARLDTRGIVGLGGETDRERGRREGTDAGQKRFVRGGEKRADGRELDAHSKRGSRFSVNALCASAKFGLCMQMACSSASLSRAVRRSRDASRLSACLVTPIANDGPFASRSASAFASAIIASD